MWKKHILYYFYLTAALGMCLLPLLCMEIRPERRSAENRQLASWPRPVKEDGSFNRDYLQESGQYFTEHFAFRQELVTMDARIREGLFNVSASDSVVVGAEDWLYYAATLDDFQHKNGVSERMLFNMAHNLSLMQQYTETLGKTFLFTVAPNKNSLYGEYMPKRLQYRIGGASDMERLKPWLERENVNYVDLYALFEGEDEILYYARDSHWNQKGAALVSNLLLAACGRAEQTYETANGKMAILHDGDLDRMLFPADVTPEADQRYLPEDTWGYEQGNDVEDDFILTVCEKGDGNLLMYRDSFGNSLLPYMANAFAQAAFSKRVPYPMTDLVVYAPDVVVVEKVERHLPTLGKVPPLMNGLLRDPEGERTAARESGAFLRLSKEGSYWKLHGMADSSYMNTDSRIYIEVEDENGVGIYEAFCVSLSEDGRSADYGFLLYLSEILVEGDTVRARIMTEKDGQIIVLHEEELEMTGKG